MATTQTKKVPRPSDLLAWARKEINNGNAIHPVVESTIVTNEVGIPGQKFTVTVPEGDGPILWGHPYANPDVPCELLGEVEVEYLGALTANGVGVYVRKGVFE
jgi:hypothetical protein